ncbi:hypothetical protein O181_022339 [Austropuccinia psidii MF-1]|uniref:Uncharacterized protein n=1 Tax=Austropuccinia psidii MF-1 TaxID=1389203 RepID=A0A9Q3CCF2_9BASI|nr:hypothetical protein [Austropuccinia psidii MF-1]
MTIKEKMYRIELINLIQGFQHEFRNSQRCSTSKMNDIEQLLQTLPRISIPLNQNEGTISSNSQVLDLENLQLNNEFPTFFHNLEPSMGQGLLKEVPNVKEWLHFICEGEYYHTEFIRGIEIIEEDFELPERLVTEICKKLFPKEAHRWYIQLRQTHGHQNGTWWKTQIINKWSHDS